MSSVRKLQNSASIEKVIHIVGGIILDRSVTEFNTIFVPFSTSNQLTSKNVEKRKNISTPVEKASKFWRLTLWKSFEKATSKCWRQFDVESTSKFWLCPLGREYNITTDTYKSQNPIIMREPSNSISNKVYEYNIHGETGLERASNHNADFQITTHYVTNSYLRQWALMVCSRSWYDQSKCLNST